jgi:CRISPR-associated endonuclease Cas1
MKKIPTPDSKLFSHPFRKAIYLLPDSSIEVDKKALSISREKKENIELATLHTIVVFGHLNLDSYAIIPILKHDISIVFFDKNGKYVGRLEPAYTLKPNIIKAQALMTKEQREHLTRRFVWGTLRNNRRFLMRCIRERSSEISEFNEALTQLNFVIKELEKKRDSLVGLLGAGLSKYYIALSKAPRQATWEYNQRIETQCLILYMPY